MLSMATLRRVTRAHRPYHHGNLRAALLDRAERMLRSGGAQELSLRELAREVGVSHGAPRRHFPDKQSLLDALAEQGFARLGAELRAAADGAGAAFDARLTALAQAYVRFATGHAALLEVMFTGKRRSGSGAVSAAAEAAFAVPLDLIAAGQDAGDIAPGDTERSTIVVFATLQGLASLVTVELLDGSAMDELVRDAIERLLLGLRPRRYQDS